MVHYFFFENLKSSVNCFNTMDEIFAPIDDDRPSSYLVTFSKKYLRRVADTGGGGEKQNQGGLNHLSYLLTISVSMAVIKDFLTNYVKAQI